MIDSKTGWLVGSSNGGPSYVVKTTDGGNTWVNETPEDEYFGFESISMVDESAGYIVGWEGKLYHTTNGGIVGIDRARTKPVYQFSLSQNYPNPFNPLTTIKYSVSEKSFISLKVYDVLGKEIAVLISEVKSPSDYQAEFNAERLPSGIYFYKITSNGYSAAKKMVVLK
jgi:hypothetical protein